MTAEGKALVHVEDDMVILHLLTSEETILVFILGTLPTSQ